MDFRNVVFNAARDGKLRRLKVFLDHRPFEEVKQLVSAQTNGATPLVLSCRNGHQEVVEYLVERWAPPLWCAAAAGHAQIVKLLVQEGKANVNSTTKTNSTPLRAACFDGHYEIVKYLVEHGANIEVANRHGHTCLMIACYKGHLRIAKYLIAIGADVNRKSVKGNTALHDCAESGSLEIMKLLLDHGAIMDVDAYGKHFFLPGADLEHAYLNVPSPTPPPSPPPRKPHLNYMEPNSSSSQPPSPPVVLLIYSKYCSVALEWARYLDRVYLILSKSKKELTIRHVPVEDLPSHPSTSIPTHLSQQLYEASLQVVLLSRPLLNLILKRPFLQFGSFLRPDRVLGIMLGVEDALLNVRHKESLASFDQWVHLEAKHNDTAFVHTVINFSIQILQKPDIKQAKINNLDKARRQKYLMFNGGGDTMRRPSSFQVFPRTLYEKGDTNILLAFHEPIDENNVNGIRILLKRTPEKLPHLPLEKIHFLNPYNISCTLPACGFLLRTSEAAISVEINGKRLDVKEPTISLISGADQFETALNTVTDPVRVLCTTYGINPPCKNRLDETLTDAFLSKRSSFLLSASIESINEEEEEKKPEKGEFPTLLHFASHYGFDKLTNTLLDCPAFERALDIRNELGCTPSDLARNNGFFVLANTLEEKMSSLLMHEYNCAELLEGKGVKNSSMGGTLRPKRASALDVVFEPDRFDHDRYGTMKGNKAISKRLDFDPPKQQEVVVGKEFKEDLAVADELLKLLDDFQKNSYSFTEMENLFKKWRRRKAEMPNEKKGSASVPLTKKSTFRKLFARNNKKNNEDCQKASSLHETTTTTTMSDCYKTDENELSVVDFPPSPGEKFHSGSNGSGLNNHINNPNNHVSSQILPLSRLSSVSSSSNSRRSLSPPNVPNNTSVIIASSSSSAQKDGGMTLSCSEVDTKKKRNRHWSLIPQEEKSSGSQEEEDAENETQIEIQSSSSSVGGGSNSGSIRSKGSSNKKQLFPSSTTTFVPQQLEEYANLPSMIITDFE
ncbi:Sex-determining protein fem-1,Protein fem-1 homolog A-A,Protein fem-1 homolog A-B,Protein fem-1 homolog B,Protein fem-1 homolog A,Protein fem-1 homolog CG6966,Protein fem-1 homolog C [Lepeophtheirus salmonis]|uniref:Sex-determining protein fem-1,Protein fem-1 homolog A-A,Protein fem-1 homolog A-B,Protein fem-1 homolog B,Protein fem-1 homolog A,Protein fem-1 homolog CG6966,Protein fem-1 homolog C n=1 Tax=Lepeophtheirus salmonis TaxID=72036 RepID=A0A7R8H449_LEPSM|nr:Sex-determining protein fem-1,Protein fem-1 homolog A-A,Protein fem-1 homolog A-B,Protein fem-1 homolog B,Protein fem-1 homolog A,Protein fem-1 homolog CG6966,Protein fem-1 homolog C [Lepeophtheirus salmonis]CAF2842198.1 Sex-determining protein fem-1,Protein fem-1 homolog A-A,Protein fem-1 homolog A-B,Protein fem-1 homolog B,Protein fem-1 homolog A,Protein fem-1 homolog CG6966,Protein fem-1 homolog C [Lepeophtheirus salmonis]